ncbi:MAG TPA: type IV secretion system protein [Steroidobacteraceae bacterium]|nr:type IV secretion system protein [Steroidobacteraceae bacterium]
MKRWQSRLLILAPLLTLGFSPAAQAQWAVIDVAAINQLIQEVTTLQQALNTAQQQLSQAQSAYAAITGNRGMSLLLSGINRNYLPSNSSQLQGVMAGTGGTYGSLASSVRSLVAQNAVLTREQMASLSPTEQSELQSQRNSTALLQAMTQDALSTTSTRFGQLQELINAIPTATDEKGILDLQARISAESTMLQNDEEKLGVLYEIARSQQEVQDEQAREQAISDIGSFRNLPPLNYQR